MVAKVFEHPFDLAKVRLQSQVLDTTARFVGPLDCLKQTWLKEGTKGLYRVRYSTISSDYFIPNPFKGLPAPIVGAMAENASVFLSYHELQNFIKRSTNRSTEETLPLYYLALAAAGSGAITSFLLYVFPKPSVRSLYFIHRTPIELVKCKMQVQMLVSTPQKNATLPGPISVLMSVLRSQGLRGLWLGHTGTLIRETGGTAAWLSTKEYIASLLITRRLTLSQESNCPTNAAHLRPWESAISGACAGVAFNLALFPADTVKSAMQTDEELRPRSSDSGKVRERPSFVRTFMAMYRKQGFRGLYAGCGITVARSIPSNAIIFLVYDGLKKHFG